MMGFGVGLSGGVYASVQSVVLRNSHMSGIPIVKLSMLMIVCCVNVIHKLCSKECLIVNLLLLGCYSCGRVLWNPSCPLFWPS